MKKVERWECEHCGELFVHEESCKDHEEKHDINNSVNEMLKDGKTLGEINEKYKLWKNLPKHLIDVTKDNCFVISYLQCCDKPAYQILAITKQNKLRLNGKGCWSGYYSQDFSVDYYNLNDPRPLNELFVHQGI